MKVVRYFIFTVVIQLMINVAAAQPAQVLDSFDLPTSTRHLYYEKHDLSGNDEYMSIMDLLFDELIRKQKELDDFLILKKSDYYESNNQ